MLLCVVALLRTTDPDDILTCPDIDLVVETIGGIEPATSFMLQAMKHGKHVVTANKAAVAANYEILQQTAAENNVQFLFEASVAVVFLFLQPFRTHCKAIILPKLWVL